MYCTLCSRREAKAPVDKSELGDEDGVPSRLDGPGAPSNTV